MSIYIHIPPYDKDRLSPLLTLFWARIIQQMTLHEPGQDEKIRVLALLDEFVHMSRISKLKEGMSFLWYYNIRIVVIVQYLSQITSIYGRDDARGFLNTKVKIAFTLNDAEDAKFFSEALGKKAVRVRSSGFNSGHTSQGASRTSNHTYQSKPLMTADQIMQMKPTDVIALIEGAYPIRFKKAMYFNDKHSLSLIKKGSKTC